MVGGDHNSQASGRRGSRWDGSCSGEWIATTPMKGMRAADQREVRIGKELPAPVSRETAD